MPGNWEYRDNAWYLGDLCIGVSAQMPVVRMELVEGWESRYYLKRDSIPVLEVECNRSGAFHTEVSW